MKKSPVGGPLMRERILDAAEQRARIGGYGGFSFREVARAVGIKSASVHYHFETKAELGAALAARYTERFLGGLGEPKGEGALERWVGGFRNALVNDRAMCLCGMLSSELDSLPEPVQSEVRSFYQGNLAWLSAGVVPPSSAPVCLALMEGALLVARTLAAPEHFERAASVVAELAAGKPETE